MKQPDMFSNLSLFHDTILDSSCEAYKTITDNIRKANDKERTRIFRIATTYQEKYKPWRKT